MEIKIIENKDNKLLERKEIEAEIYFDTATTRKNELKEAIGKKVGLNHDFLVLRKVTNVFGTKKVKVLAHGYENAETLKKTEPKHIRVRMGLEAAEKKEKAKKEPKKDAEKK